MVCGCDERGSPEVGLSPLVTLTPSGKNQETCGLAESGITGETENNHPEKFVAMNRKNTANEFSQLTESELDRKRKEMLEKLKKKQDRPKS